MLPNFLIIGAMKAGTTSLHHYLSQHPDVQMSSRKELHFFTSNRYRGLEWYESFFEGAPPKKLRGEASPSYSKFHEFDDVPGEIAAALGHSTKLLYLVRQPIDRALSHIMHSRAAGESRTDYEEALRSMSYGNTFIQTSLYGAQLSRFRDVFPTANILVLETEQLEQHRNAAMTAVCAFLGIDADALDAQSLETRLHASETKLEYNSLSFWLSRHLTMGRPGQYRNNALVRLALLKKLPRPALSPTFHDELMQVFENDIDQLESLTGRRYESLRQSSRYLRDADA